MNEIYLYGTVGASWWDEDYFTAKTVRDALANLSGPISVRINSGGGIASEGQAIYTALRGYNGQVNVIIEGIAASAASLIAMAGDTITMTPGAILMIHDPANEWVEGRGTEDDHLAAATMLRTVANSYAEIYAKAAGMSVEDARTIMKAETYYDGAAAFAAGFVTAFGEDGDPSAPTAFDYRVYKNAPAKLLEAAGSIQRLRPRASILAMMAGFSIPPAKGAKAMAKNKPAPSGGVARVTASENEEALSEEDEETDLPEAETIEDPEVDEEETSAEDADGDEEDVSPPAEALAIYRMCARAGLASDRAEHFISRGLTCAQALAELNGKGDKAKMKNHAPRARILRDERETRRAGMAGALVAQMQRQREVSGPARDYMGMSLIDMVAASIGYRGSLRSPGDRLSVLASASHSTSDFPAIFENALNKQLLDRYEAVNPTYRAIARKRNFVDFRDMSLVRSGDFPMLKKIGENGEIKFGTFGESGEIARISSYGVGLTISRQMMINDDLGAIDDTISRYGESIALFEEVTFYEAALSAVMKSDGKAMFHADHGNLASAASAITVTAVSAGRSAMIKQKNVDKNPILGNEPTILLVGADKLTEAEQFVNEITATKTSDVNVFTGGRLKPLMTTQIADNSWYLLSERNPNWVYGYLDGAEAPRLRTEEPFGTQGFSMTLEHDFGIGAADWRGGYKNAGV